MVYRLHHVCVQYDNFFSYLIINVINKALYLRYTLLVGKPPFETSSLKETYSRISRCDYNIPSHLNKNATTLITKMLQRDPKKRPSVLDLLNADFFTTGYMPKKLPPSCLTMAPRFDSLNYRESISNRKPLNGNKKLNILLL